MPETVESETTPTPTQIEAPGSNQTEAPEGIPIVSAKTKDSFAAQQIADEDPEEPPVATEPESKPVLPEPKKRGRPRKEQSVPKAAREPKTPNAAPKKAVRMKPPSVIK